MYSPKITILAVALLLTAPLYAEHPRRREFSTSDRIERMTRFLELSSDQQGKIKTILEKTRDKQKELRQQEKTDILAILNDSQKTKFESREKMREEKFKEKMERKEETAE